MPALILLVNVDRVARRQIEGLLSDEGYLVAPVSSFQQAKDLLASISPDLLVADVRLGAFNGLHLAARSQFYHPSLPVVITHATHDPVLERDATRLGATYMVNPLDNPAFLPLVKSVLEQHRRAQMMIRRWPRKRVALDVEAHAASVRARIVDMSYGGLRLEFEDRAENLPAVFDLTLPTAGITLRAYRVWTGHARESAALWCGAEVADTGTSATSLWRELVDATN
jgi:DNA-binding response OmpR family regulator